MNVYENAAQLIEELGWWQGSANGPNGELCMFSAIDKASGHAWLLSQVYADLGLREIGGWNDEPERTVTEVLAKLRETAAKLTEQDSPDD